MKYWIAIEHAAIKQKIGMAWPKISVMKTTMLILAHL